MRNEYKASLINQLAFPFELILPLEYEGQPLLNINIETRNNSKIIFEKDFISKK